MQLLRNAEACIQNHKQLRGFKQRYLALLLPTIAVTGCVSLPDVYLIDHHTVMEEEASGEWPQLEQRFHDLAVTPGPVDLARETDTDRRDRAFSVLNGEMTTSVDESSNNQ